MSPFMTSFFRDPAHVFYTLAVLTQLALFGRWLLRSYANNRIQRQFVNDMATNHLPHIYHGLTKIAESQGIELKDPPPIQWAKINGNGKLEH